MSAIFGSLRMRDIIEWPVIVSYASIYDIALRDWLGNMIRNSTTTNRITSYITLSTRRSLK